ncbi:cytochrome ubiquinol oxidase subunit I [Chachezhania sediminis]|uniref:cytochrome ubiquinol oxidase subunit I n=1 Tax=Chachezhania sediminis TaxID=2599291 RepID=UPI00131E3CCD|nr:cytochrome ubiquinol oxidase subunit I [Chachezhania sediminis]
MDVLLLARTQFGILASFHALFPAITLMLGWVLFGLYARALRQRDSGGASARDKRRVRAFWTRVHALAFMLSGISALALSAQAAVLQGTEAVFSPLAGLGFLVAFGMQALGLVVLLARRMVVRRRVQAAGALLVALGGTLWSAELAILGYLVGGAAAGVTLLQSGLLALLISNLTVGSLLSGLSSLRILTGERTRAQRAMLRTGLWMTALSAPLIVLFCARLARLDGTQATVFAVALVALALLSWATLSLQPRHGSQVAVGLPSPGLLTGLLGASFAGWPVTLILLHGAVPLRALMPLPLPAGVAGDLPQTMVAYAAVTVLLVAFFCAAIVGMARNAAVERSARIGMGLLPAE